MWCPTKNLGPIGSAVLTFIGYKRTDKQTDKQTDKPNLYIDKMSNIKYALSLLRRRTEYKYVFTEKRLKVT